MSGEIPNNKSFKWQEVRDMSEEKRITVRKRDKRERGEWEERRGNETLYGGGPWPWLYVTGVCCVVLHVNEM